MHRHYLSRILRQLGSNGRVTHARCKAAISQVPVRFHSELASTEADYSDPSPYDNEMDASHLGPLYSPPHRGGGVATVFGCNGFLGEHICQKLAENGYSVITPFRGEETAVRDLKLCGTTVGQIIPLRINVRDEATLERAIYHADVVVNCISRWWETRNFTFQDVNVTAAATIARLARKVDKFVHISAANVSEDSPSEWARTKALGDAAVRKANPRAIILKPTVMFGTSDRLIHRHGRLLKVCSFGVPVCPEYDQRQIQPVYGGDVADALMASLYERQTEGKTFTLGGPRVYTWAELFQKCRKASRRFDTRTLTSEKNYLRWAYICEKMWLVGGDPIYSRAELTHYGKQDVVVPKTDPSFEALHVNSRRLKTIDDHITKVMRTYRHPELMSDELEQNPGAFSENKVF